MSIKAAVGGRAMERALLIFVVLAGVLAMHGLTTGHDALMPSSHPSASVMSHADDRSQPPGHGPAAVTAAMDMSTYVSAVTESVVSYLPGAPMPAMTMGAACTAILTGALALVLLALALAHSRSRSGSAPGHHERAPRWPTDLGPPRRTSLTLAQLSLSRT